MNVYDRPTIDPTRLRTTATSKNRFCESGPISSEAGAAECFAVRYAGRGRMMAAYAIGAMLQISAAGRCE
jgi:hypothetical protein